MRRRRSLQLLGWLLLAAMATLALLGAPPWPSGGDYSSSAPAELTRHPFWMYDPVVQEPRDARQLCSLPVVHPLHPSVWPHLKRTVPIQCKVRQPWLTFVDIRGNLRFNHSSGYKLESLRCTYTPAERNGDDKVIYGDPVPFTRDETPLQHDVVYVSCRNYFEMPVYSNVHAVLRIPKSIRQRSSMMTSSPPEPQDPPSVLVFGLDSISRLSMMRLLPKTYTFLADVLGSVVFRGMNKLKHPGTNGDTFDDVQFIWDDFKRGGYLTLFAEDFPEYAVFNYLARGFRDPPTDFYYRPYCLAMENSFLMRTSSNLCYGNVPKHKLQIDYVRRFIEVNNGSRPYFAFSFLVEISHEYMQQVAAADETYCSSSLNYGTVAIWTTRSSSSSPTTVTGSAANSLAQSTTVTSASLLKALQSNAGRLTTPYDTYETFRDILSLGKARRFRRQTKIGLWHKPVSRDTSQAKLIVVFADARERLFLLRQYGRPQVCRRCGSHSASVRRIRVTVVVHPSDAMLEGLLLVREDQRLVVFDDISRINKYGRQSSCIEHQTLRKYCYCIQNQ
ncbi:hypothetical protein MTO96_050880 [Rhipicephalus appendiculatus]